MKCNLHHKQYMHNSPQLLIVNHQYKLLVHILNPIMIPPSPASSATPNNPGRITICCCH